MIREGEKEAYVFKIKDRKEKCTTPSIQHVAAKWKQRPSSWWGKNRPRQERLFLPRLPHRELVSSSISFISNFSLESISEWRCVCGGCCYKCERTMCVVIIVHIIWKGIFFDQMMRQTTLPKPKQLWECTTSKHQSSTVPKWQWFDVWPRGKRHPSNDLTRTDTSRFVIKVEKKRCVLLIWQTGNGWLLTEFLGQCHLSSHQVCKRSLAFICFLHKSLI